MALERNLSAVAPVLLTANGTTTGVLTLASTAGFFVKQQITLQAATISPQSFEIKRVVDQYTIWVGPKGPSMTAKSDISAFTVAAGSFAFAVEWPKSEISMETRLLASYEQEPINAWRTTSVDVYGNPYGPGNPYPISFDGTIAIGKVEVEGRNGNTIEPNTDGSLNVVIEDGASVQIINQFAEAVAVPPNATATIISYPAASSYATYLQKVTVSGENVAKFDVQVNGATIDTKRTYWCNLNEQFDFMTDSASTGYPLNPGDIVTVIVLNYSPTQVSANFDSRIQLVRTPS